MENGVDNLTCKELEFGFMRKISTVLSSQWLPRVRNLQLPWVMIPACCAFRPATDFLQLLPSAVCQVTNPAIDSIRENLCDESYRIYRPCRFRHSEPRREQLQDGRLPHPILTNTLAGYPLNILCTRDLIQSNSTCSSKPPRAKKDCMRF